jgi:hypothetical protein
MGALVAGEFPTLCGSWSWRRWQTPIPVHATVASTLGVLPQEGMTTLESILEWLEGRRLLLILDSCEHGLALSNTSAPRRAMASRSSARTASTGWARSICFRNST